MLQMLPTSTQSSIQSSLPTSTKTRPQVPARRSYKAFNQSSTPQSFSIKTTFIPEAEDPNMKSSLSKIALGPIKPINLRRAGEPPVNGVNEVSARNRRNITSIILTTEAATATNRGSSQKEPDFSPHKSITLNSVYQSCYRKQLENFIIPNATRTPSHANIAQLNQRNQAPIKHRQNSNLGFDSRSNEQQRGIISKILQKQIGESSVAALKDTESKKHWSIKSIARKSQVIDTDYQPSNDSIQALTRNTSIGKFDPMDQPKMGYSPQPRRRAKAYKYTMLNSLQAKVQQSMQGFDYQQASDQEQMSPLRSQFDVSQERFLSSPTLVRSPTLARSPSLSKQLPPLDRDLIRKASKESTQLLLKKASMDLSIETVQNNKASEGQKSPLLKVQEILGDTTPLEQNSR